MVLHVSKRNSLSQLHAVVKAIKSCHTAPILCSLHRLKITEFVDYKLISLKKILIVVTNNDMLVSICYTSLEPAPFCFPSTSSQSLHL